VHKLNLVQEELEDRARAKAELARRVADKRRELVEQAQSRRLAPTEAK
jgi:hypothetical protein